LQSIHQKPEILLDIGTPTHYAYRRTHLERDSGKSGMPHDPKAIANYFLDLADRENRSLSPMKLQKLIYYANGWMLALKAKPLLNEQIEAWRFGPVISSIYHEFRSFGNQPITERASSLEYGEATGGGFDVNVVSPSIDDEPVEAEYTKNLLDKVWEIYGGYSAVQLSNMTHAEGSPWHHVFQKWDGSLPRGTDIPVETIREFFTGLLQRETVAK